MGISTAVLYLVILLGHTFAVHKIPCLNDKDMTDMFAGKINLNLSEDIEYILL